MAVPAWLAVVSLDINPDCLAALTNDTCSVQHTHTVLIKELVHLKMTLVVGLVLEGIPASNTYSGDGCCREAMRAHLLGSWPERTGKGVSGLAAASALASTNAPAAHAPAQAQHGVQRLAYMAVQGETLVLQPQQRTCSTHLTASVRASLGFVKSVFKTSNLVALGTLLNPMVYAVLLPGPAGTAIRSFCMCMPGPTSYW